MESVRTGCGLAEQCYTGISAHNVKAGGTEMAVDAEGGTAESLLGKVGRVTVSIPAHGPGEVLLSVRGGSEAFAAWSDVPVPRHSRVVVVEALSARSVFVTQVEL
jgi:hypothetical protein